MKKVELPHISIDENNEGTLLNAKYGPYQVKTLLRLVLDPSTEKRLDDAADDALAIYHLNRLKAPRG
jgi:hypothetical protein